MDVDSDKRLFKFAFSFECLANEHVKTRKTFQNILHLPYKTFIDNDTCFMTQTQHSSLFFQNIA